MSGRTPFATRVYDTPQKSVRVPAGTPTFVVVHHTGGSRFEATIALELGGKQVSSTVIIDGDDIASMFDEYYRAWSLSSQHWDSVSLSSETCNSGGAAEGWPISEASYRSLAKVIADWCRRYSIPANRERILGHREVYTRYGASYATACPGGIDLDRVVRDVQSLLATPKKGTDDMTIYAPTTDWAGRPTALIISDLRSKELVTDSTRIALLKYLGPAAVNGPGITNVPEATWKQLAALPNFPNGSGGATDLAPVLAAIADLAKSLPDLILTRIRTYWSTGK